MSVAVQHKPDGRKRRLGNPLNAEPSVSQLTARKTDKAAPFKPLFHRLDIDGKVAIITQDSPETFYAITEKGVWINPWTKKPFTNLENCQKATAYFLRKGFWPKKVEGVQLT